MPRTRLERLINFRFYKLRNYLVFDAYSWREFLRWLLCRDNCEFCNGTQGMRGNENVICGKIVCDYCSKGVKA